MKNTIRESKSSKVLEIIIEEPINNKMNVNNKKRRIIKSLTNINFSAKKRKSNKKKSSMFLINNNLKHYFKDNNLQKRFSDFSKLFKETINEKENRDINLSQIKTQNNKLIGNDIGEINIKTKNSLKRPKSHSYIQYKDIINKNKNIQKDLYFNFLSNESNNNLYITATPFFPLTNINKKFETFENIKNKNNQTKKYLNRNKSSILFPKKLKTLDEIIKEKEIKLDNNYRPQKIKRNALNRLYKNDFLQVKKDLDNINDKYNYIKSNLNKITKSSEIREKINLVKFKEYSSFKNIFKSSYKNIINLKSEIKKLKDKKYISLNNVDTLNNYKKYLISSKNYLFYEDLKSNFMKKNKQDTFAFSEFCNKIKSLDGTVAFKLRYFLANKLGFNWDTIYLYKKNQRHLILKNTKKKFFSKNNIQNKKPDDFLF